MAWEKKVATYPSRSAPAIRPEKVHGVAPLDSRLFLCRGYTGLISDDLIAGITVGLVALPLAMAFGIASA
jgi:MFS superfamily sulfate permease-like transporter